MKTIEGMAGELGPLAGRHLGLPGRTGPGEFWIAAGHPCYLRDARGTDGMSWQVGVTIGAYTARGEEGLMAGEIHLPSLSRGVTIRVATSVPFRSDESVQSLRERTIDSAFDALGEALAALRQVPLPELEQADRTAAYWRQPQDDARDDDE